MKTIMRAQAMRIILYGNERAKVSARVYKLARNSAEPGDVYIILVGLQIFSF